MTLEQAIRWYLDRGQERGLTATPGHGDYGRASSLDFRRCECSARDGEWTMPEHLARTRRGAHLYLGTNAQGIVSLGSEGYHSSKYRKGPPCI
jgi:hypothetical protein